jgi:hypothetical protein
VRVPVSILVALVALALVACGGDEGDEATTSTDVNQLLDDTFSGDQRVDSGKVDLAVRLETQGGDEPGTVSIDLDGPFQSEGEGRLPKFQLALSFDGGGESLTAGATSTGDQGFVSFQGTDYELSGPVFEQFKAAYEQAQKQGAQQQGQSLATLGIDPRKWLTDAKNAGEAEVGDTETIKITGGVDVPRLLDDVNAALEQLRSLGVQGSEELPERLSEEQMRQATEAIENLSVEIYTGKEDKILRRLVVSLDLTAPEGSDVGGASSAAVRLDLQLLDVNEDQQIDAPQDARPFEELAESLGGLGLGGAAGSGAGSGGGTDPQNLEEFSQCVQAAGNDTAKQRECSKLLNP